MNLTKSKTKRIVAGFVGVALAVAFALPAQGATVGELTAQINSLLQTIAALQAQMATLSGGTTGGSTTGYVFSTNLTIGSKGADVTALQQILVSKGYLTMPAGVAMGYFGPLTQSAVSKWQAAAGISPTAGYVGPKSRAALNAMAGTGGTTGGGTIIPPSGATLSVAAGTQPAQQLAVESAARVPFTKFTLTAGSADVTVNSVTVSRVGPAADTAFAGVALVDENGVQIGIAKTLGSTHQANIGEPFIVKAGTTRTLTVVGNMAASLDARAGEFPAFQVVSINTSAPVTGSLPITGTAQVINATLVVGSATPARGALDPNATISKEIGTTGYTFSSIRVSAGSGENIRIYSIRWNQSGSASASDLANVVTIVDGVSYPTTISADGKYYTTTFGSGIVIAKGFSKEISVKADIVSGSSRTVAFDLYKNTDLYVSGETYGYGITPVSTGTGFATTAPWYDASVVTITGGSASTISTSNSVPAQNISILAANQPLGGWEVKIRGEAITVAQMVFNILATGDEAENITSVSLVNQNGAVVAGPVDAVNISTNSPGGTVTFTDTVTFPVGDTTLTLRGQLGSAFASNDTVQASTTPSTQWTTVTGTNTGNTVSLSSFSSILTGNLMTVRAGALAISVSAQPTARSVIAGATGFEFARYVLDASQSGEDIRISNFIASTSVTTVTASQLSNCNLYDGSTNVTNDTNVTLAAGSNTFTFNGGGIIIPKGTQKTLSMKCDLASGATSGNIRWGLVDNSLTYTSAVGVSSGITVTETMTASNGQLMTAASTGSYTVTEDTSLLYGLAQAGSQGVTLAKFRFTAGASEGVALKQIALQLGNTSSSSPADLVGERVTLWNGLTQIGTAQFGGANADNATSTPLSPAPVIAAGEAVVITVKGALSAQNLNEGTPGAFLAVTYDGNNVGINGNYATGADSQATVSSGTTSDVTTAGLRIFRTVPTIAVTSSGGTGTLNAGADLYKFTVSNGNNRDVVFQKFTFSIATSGSAVNGFTLYGDGVAFNTSAVTVSSTEGDPLEITASGTSNAQIISANSTKTYILKAATVPNASTSVIDSITLALLADTSYPSLAGLIGTVTTVEAGSANTDNIIWSPFSTTTPVATAATQDNLDWTNGYGLPGFPSNTAFPTQTWTSAN